MLTSTSSYLSIFKLIRIKQWVKNGFLLLPLIFSGYFMDRKYLIITLTAFLGFSLVSSAVYIFNDVLDRERDQAHPKKRHRPIAAGLVAVPLAAVLGVVCLCGGSFLMYSVNPDLLRLAGLYILLQVLYNFSSKNYMILDVVTLALGFQIRIWVGCVAIGVMPSLWLQLCVFFLSLFLGFAKRRSELYLLKECAHCHREVLADYSPLILDHLVGFCAGLAIFMYALYSSTSAVAKHLGRGFVVYSIGFVICGIARYLYLVYVKFCGEDLAEILLKDMYLFLTVLLWLYYMAFLIYIIK